MSTPDHARRRFLSLSTLALGCALGELLYRRTWENGLDAAVLPTSTAASGPLWRPTLPAPPTALPSATPELPRPARRSDGAPRSAWLPLFEQPAMRANPLLLGTASGTTTEAISWLAPRASGYTLKDVTLIVNAYARLGTLVGVDWFLAIGQLDLETGSLTSWWSQVPRRNPAGIGVTGRTRAGTPDLPPGPAWAWDGTLWREGVSFATWASDAIPAHLGRLLAYALTDDQASPVQTTLIDRALAYRSLPAADRGVAPTLSQLNGRWAVPGTDYGQHIAALLDAMRHL